jgi:hypothetical protein
MQNTSSAAASQTRGAAGLSLGFYMMAHEITTSMVNRGLHEGGSYRYTASVIILAQASLESYINEFFFMQRQFPAQPIEAKYAELGLNPFSLIEDKWYNAPLLFGDKTFDRGAEPFQSFALLVSLRNTLVHYDPEFLTPMEFPSSKIESLKSKFTFSYPGSADWTSQILNLECARWGLSTVKALIPKLHELAGGIDYSSVGRPWPDPP